MAGSDEEAGKVPAACVVLNQNAKESEGEIMNYVSCNVVHYKRVIVLQWTQFQSHLKERAYIKEIKMPNKLISSHLDQKLTNENMALFI